MNVRTRSLPIFLLAIIGGCDPEARLGALGGLNGANAPEHWTCEPGPETVPPTDDYVPENHPDCPETGVQLNGSSCDLPAGSACAYHSEGFFTACVCGCAPTEEWGCFSRSEDPGCPDEQPIDGDGCSSPMKCHYLSQTTCECEENAWSCEWDPADPGTQPDDPTCFAGPWSANTDPSGISSCTRVNELTIEEATAWCRWYTAAYRPEEDDPEPDVYPVSEGYVSHGAAMGCGPSGPSGESICIQHLGVEQCVANLMRGDCPLALGQVEDCARTLINECRVVEDGCGPLLSIPTCHATVVQVNAQSFCAAPVE